ncbi:MAG: hypothetical protein WCI73_16255, partial [Phycisphaerae bacterium]
MQITLVHAGALGDTLLLVPLLRGLRTLEAGGLVRITVVMRPDFGRLLVHLGAADKWASVEDFSHSSWFGDAIAGPPPGWADCDLLVSAVSNGRDVWAGHARAALAAFSGGRLYCFEPRPPENFAGHVTQWQRQQLVAQGLRLPELAPSGNSGLDGPQYQKELSARTAAKALRCHARLRAEGGGGLVFHPGSGGVAKCWGWERFLEIAGRWERERGEKA